MSMTHAQLHREMEKRQKPEKRAAKLLARKTASRLTQAEMRFVTQDALLGSPRSVEILERLRDGESPSPELRSQIREAARYPRLELRGF